ncbi:MAG TPA: CoA-binding protein [Candidatus Binatia bacterium]|nr:CoA-binding protein [Candidatus Binatia bacterium]
MNHAFENPPDDEIRRILATPRTVAVVGCSPDPARDSHRIARLLADRGHRVIPVNPTCSEVLGRRCYPDLESIPEPVDMVDVFRRSEHVSGVADEAIAVGARVLWLQLGVIDHDAALRARAAGITVVMDRCPAIEYRRLF